MEKEKEKEKDKEKEGNSFLRAMKKILPGKKEKEKEDKPPKEKEKEREKDKEKEKEKEKEPEVAGEKPSAGPAPSDHKELAPSLQHELLEDQKEAFSCSSAEEDNAQPKENHRALGSPFFRKRKSPLSNHEPAFLSSSPRLSPKRSKVPSHSRERSEEPGEHHEHPHGKPPQEGPEFIPRRSDRLKQSAGDPKSSSLFSPLFLDTTSKQLVMESDSEPVTPEDQKEVISPLAEPPPSERKGITSGTKARPKQVRRNASSNYHEEDSPLPEAVNEKLTPTTERMDIDTSSESLHDAQANNSKVGHHQMEQPEETTAHQKEEPLQSCPSDPMLPVAHEPFPEEQSQERQEQSQQEQEEKSQQEQEQGEGNEVLVLAAPDEQDIEVVEEEESSEEEEEEIAEFDPYYFIRTLPPLAPHFINRQQDLPPKSSDSPPITLVLDLDETLVHCTTNPIPNPDLIFPVQFNGEAFQVYVLKRPHLEQFLERVSQLFEVVVFTASQQIYADALLDLIDPGRHWIKYRLFRESCLCVEGNYLKELSILGRDLSKTIIVDNSPQAFGYQIDNGIPILSWFEDKQDHELLAVLAFLEELVGVEDIRPVIKSKFQLQNRVNSIQL